MSANEHTKLSRRSFLQGASALGSGALLLEQGMAQAAELAPAKTLPRRVLGKTKQEVTALALGTWRRRWPWEPGPAASPRRSIRPV
jgi:hypothetical protein